jgi:uncharacterized membrane protein
MATSKSSSGVGSTMVQFLIFLTLKLTGLISWSWWWVTSPLWIPVLLAIAILIIIASVIIIAVALGFSTTDIKSKLKRNE